MQYSETASCVQKKYYIWNSATYCCENSEYLVSPIDDSLRTCDKYCVNKFLKKVR